MFYFFFDLLYTVPTMHAIFVVHCRVNMKPLNRTQPSNLQLCSNQSTNHSSWFGVRGPPQNTSVPSPHVCKSVPDYVQSVFRAKIMWNLLIHSLWRMPPFRLCAKKQQLMNAFDSVLRTFDRKSDRNFRKNSCLLSVSERALTLHLQTFLSIYLALWHASAPRIKEQRKIQR